MCLRPQFIGSIDQEYCDICHEISQFIKNVCAKSVLHMKPPKSLKLAQGRVAAGQGKNRVFENRI